MHTEQLITMEMLRVTETGLEKLELSGTPRQLELAISTAIKQGWYFRPRDLRRENRLGQAFRAVSTIR